MPHLGHDNPLSFTYIVSRLNQLQPSGYRLHYVSRITPIPKGPLVEGRNIMSQQNKMVERRLIEEVWNRGNYAVVDELVPPHLIVVEH
jgi:hypothetical protein